MFPLAALGILLSVRQSPWWLVAFVAIIVLLEEGRARLDQSRRIVWDELKGLLDDDNALRDPTLTLAYWLPEFACYVDSGGHMVELPKDSAGRLTAIVEQDGENVAAIVYDASLEEEQKLLGAVIAAAGFALKNERLSAELRARVSELGASRSRILDAGDKERRRLDIRSIDCCLGQAPTPALPRRRERERTALACLAVFHRVEQRRAQWRAADDAFGIGEDRRIAAGDSGSAPMAHPTLDRARPSAWPRRGR